MIICLFSSSISRLCKGYAAPKEVQLFPEYTEIRYFIKTHNSKLMPPIDKDRCKTTTPLLQFLRLQRAIAFALQWAFHLQVCSLPFIHVAMAVLLGNLLNHYHDSGFPHPFTQAAMAMVFRAPVVVVFPCCSYTIILMAFYLQTLILLLKKLFKCCNCHRQWGWSPFFLSFPTMWL